jgi:ATP-dependent RNA helicase DDX3X
MAPFLTKVLMECRQPIPDFLEQYKPEGDLNFDEEEEAAFDEALGDNQDGGDTWGVGDAAEPAWGGDNTASGTEAWGTGDATGVAQADDSNANAGGQAAAW